MSVSIIVSILTPLPLSWHSGLLQGPVGAGKCQNQAVSAEPTETKILEDSRLDICCIKFLYWIIDLKS